MAAWKIGPATAAGCCVILKPAKLTSLTALFFAQLCKEAGFPPGVVNVIPGGGGEVGNSLAEHMDVDKIAFTGSTGVCIYMYITHMLIKIVQNSRLYIFQNSLMVTYSGA